MRDFRYTHTLGGYECLKAAEFYINKEIAGDFGPAVSTGILLHTQVEEFLKTPNQGPWPVNLFALFEALIAMGPFLLIEEKLEVDDGDFLFKGVIDGYTKDGWLVDWKFPNKSWDQDKANKYISSQGILYPWAMKKLGHQVKGMKFLVCPTQESGVLQTFIVPAMDDETLEKLMRPHKNRYRMLLQCARMDNWTPNPSKWNCRFCAWKKHCDYSRA